MNMYLFLPFEHGESERTEISNLSVAIRRLLRFSALHIFGSCVSMAGTGSSTDQNWDLFASGHEEVQEHEPDPEGWGGPREDRTAHLGLLSATWTHAKPEGVDFLDEAPEDPWEVQDLVQYYSALHFEDLTEFKDRKYAVWDPNDEKGEPWMVTQAATHDLQRGMGLWSSVLQEDLCCTKHSINKFRELLTMGPAGYMEATRLMHHIFKGKNRPEGQANHSEKWGGYLSKCCDEAMETLRAMSLGQPTFKGHDKGHGKGKDQGTCNGKNEANGKNMKGYDGGHGNPWNGISHSKSEFQRGPA